MMRLIIEGKTLKEYVNADNGQHFLSYSLSEIHAAAQHNYQFVLFCSLAFLDPRVGHTMDVLSPFISILCHSD